MAFDGIAWHAPWFSPFREPGATLADSPNWIAAANQFSEERQPSNHRGMSVHFIPHVALPEEIGYEAHISATGQVPTRDNLHDFFNALT